MKQLNEDKRTEFKIKLTDDLEKEVIAFLNTDGGNMFIGVDDKGKVQGNLGNVDLLQRTIKDRLKDNIVPSTLGLFDVILDNEDGKDFIQIVVAKGNERPYYLRGMGMTPDSCFIRVGSSVVSMNNETILNLYSKRTKNSLKNIKSPEQELEFSTLKLYYQEKGFEVNNNFLNKLEFYNDDKEFNYIAYLFADNNKISVQFAKYKDDDVYNLIENEELGFCSLIKIADNVLNKLRIENKTFTKIETPTRKEIKMYNYDCVKELVINALVHNDWCYGYSPKFEIFKSKLVVSSNGGIQEGVSQTEFLEGFSNPRNPEIMRIFRDLNFAEQLGTGIQRVLKFYDKSIFQFYPNHIRVTIPFNQNTLEKQLTTDCTLGEIENSILKLINDNPDITQDEIANKLDISKRTVSRHFKNLLDGNYIERVGSSKSGHWKINKNI